MLSKKITDGTEFIVFDLEWNQPYPGYHYKVDASTLPGEIIEIGAVKYIYDNGRVEKKDDLSITVRPVVYKKIHYHVKKVTHKTNEDLRHGIPFEEAAEKFRNFTAGADILVGWGNSDTKILKSNMKFFGVDDELRMFFLDLQPIFSGFSGQKGQQRSVEFAVDYYDITKDDGFHSATADAIYTGEIFEHIFEANKPTEVISAISSSSVDPDLETEFNTVGSEADTVEEAFSNVSNFVSHCPLCGAELEPQIAKFRIRKSEYALLKCKKHGDYFIRVRVKRNARKHYYAATVMRFATQNDYWLVASKKEEFEKFGVNGAPVKKEDTEKPTCE